MQQFDLRVIRNYKCKECGTLIANSRKSRQFDVCCDCLGEERFYEMKIVKPKYGINEQIVKKELEKVIKPTKEELEALQIFYEEKYNGKFYSQIYVIAPKLKMIRREHERLHCIIGSLNSFYLHQRLIVEDDDGEYFCRNDDDDDDADWDW